MSKRVSISPRATPPWTVRVVVPTASLIAAAVVGGLMIVMAGNDAFEAYKTILDSSFNGLRPLTRTMTLATPLILTGLAAAIAFRMKIWNIGAEGQLYMGAVAASGLALTIPSDIPKPLMIVVILAPMDASG